MVGHSDEPARPMYVQICARVLVEDGRLTLVDLAPATFFVTEEPGTSVGHLPTGVFLDHWYADDSGPGTRSVPAILSFLDADRPGSANSRLLVSLPRIRDAGLEYQARVLEGAVSPTSGACVLFIRPLTAPVTPVAAARSPLRDRPTPFTT